LRHRADCQMSLVLKEMEDSAQALLFAEIKKPLLGALEALSPHFREIDSDWRNLLGNFVLGENEVAALSDLVLPAEAQTLRSGRFDMYRASLERKGQELEKLGVPERIGIAALGFYLECCLPFLVEDRHREKTYLEAMAHLTASAQLFVMSGYSTQRALNWRRIEEQERHRLSRDLHDEIGHNFLVLKLYMEMMAIDLEKENHAKVKQKLEEALALVKTGIESVRRLVLDLGPAILDELGLMPALKLYARQFQSRTGIKVIVQESNVPANLPPLYETALYRVVQGALSNVLKHSRASTVKIVLGTTRGSVLIVIIEDDGIGFDATMLKSQTSFGLTAIRERIEGLGGRFHLESWPASAKGRRKGTRIEVDLPLVGTEGS